MKTPRFFFPLTPRSAALGAQFGARTFLSASSPASPKADRNVGAPGAADAQSDAGRQKCRRSLAALLLAAWLLATCAAHAAPTVSNLRAAQRPGTKLVDITYDLADPGVASVSIWILV